MERTKLLTLGGVLAGVAGLWTAWGVYARTTAAPVPYTTLDEFEGVELREYPDLVAVETTAGGDVEAFRRLYDYISGGNRRAEDVAMTAPVATADAGEDGTDVPMTAPVATSESEDGVTMRFYLPGTYTIESAPEPTNDSVELVRIEAHRAAVVPFGWYATDRRIEHAGQHLLDTLAAYGIDTVGSPYLLRYNDPWTPPWMRRNEVVVDVET
ncbi:SOUL family heme-binding protein [Haloarchaeobius sp. HRN-SO-5]|uniref:SOUL family heme-binding protein n=1 Tax=Haloarchaeobius sp. HRN-SO-5 TaxID=3446118 RepID=UPI003EBA67E5